MELSPDQHWYLHLTVDGTVEDSVVLQRLTEPALETAIEDLMVAVRMEINPFQIKKLMDDLKRETSHIFINERRQNDLSEPETSQQIQTRQISQQVIPAGSSFQLQRNLIQEYRDKLTQSDPIEVKEIKLNELSSHIENSDQIKALVDSHREVQHTLKMMDDRIARLETVTKKLVEITELFLSEKMI